MAATQQVQMPSAKTTLWLRSVLLGCSLATPAVAATPSVTTLLKAADLARSGSEEGMTWEVSLDSEDQGTKTSSRYLVKTLGDNAIAEALSPARSKGELMLFNSRLLWFFRPSLSRPVSLPMRQRLSGQAANGDIAHTNYARDYDGTVTGEETVGGVPTYVLQLTAKTPDTTYDKIRYWISKDKQQGIKAQYMALDGTPLKVATFTYGNKVKVKDKDVDFVQTMHLEDAVNTKNFSDMHFSAPHVEKHAETIFNVNNIRR